MTTLEQIQWFRSAAPYINAFRHKTFVIVIPGEVVRSELFENLVHDIALCHHLGIKLVLVHGSRQQIDEQLAADQIETSFHQNIRISSREAMPSILKAIHQVRNLIEARLSMGLPNTPMSGSDISVVSGNFITGMPLGIIEGVDMQHSGRVRSIDSDTIHQLLHQHIVLVSNIGYSKSGELFNLPAEEMGAEIARALKAQKLIYFHSNYLTNPLTDQFSTEECTHQINQGELDEGLKALLEHAVYAVEHDVPRVHIIDETLDGGLLQELFTRDGAGMMVTNRFYEGIRSANINDIGGILELIQPLEQSGILVKRSREQLELEIDFFRVIEKDGLIIGCIACVPDMQSKKSEVACVAVHRDYQKTGLGDQMLAAVELEAKKQGQQHLFILTTRTSHWFMEKGFTEQPVEFLPPARLPHYSPDRRSRVMAKTID